MSEELELRENKKETIILFYWLNECFDEYDEFYSSYPSGSNTEYAYISDYAIDNFRDPKNHGLLCEIFECLYYLCRTVYEPENPPDQAYNRHAYEHRLEYLMLCRYRTIKKHGMKKQHGGGLEFLIYNVLKCIQEYVNCNIKGALRFWRVSVNIIEVMLKITDMIIVKDSKIFDLINKVKEEVNLNLTLLNNEIARENEEIMREREQRKKKREQRKREAKMTIEMKINETFDKLSELIECPISLDEVTDCYMIKKCGHKFGVDILSLNRCPLCRCDIICVYDRNNNDGY